MFSIGFGRAGQTRAAFSSFGLFCVYVFLGAGMCHAQDPPQQKPDLAKMSIEDLLNVRVYAASKHLQNLSDAPSSVTIVTAEEIQEYGYRTLADILENVRSFYITSDDYFSYVGVRGFGRLGDWNSRILLLIDGHRINDNIDGQATIGSEFPVDVNLIQRVEIVRGASSSLYGANAFFAVINVITRKAPDLKGVELSVTPSSFHSYEGRASIGGQYKGIGAVLSDTYYSSPGRTLFFPEFDSPATNFGITSHTDYENYHHALATITYQGFTLQGLLGYRDKGVPTAYFGALFNDPRTRNTQENDYVDLSYQRAIGSNWQLAARTSWDRAYLNGPVAFASSKPPDTYAYRGQWWDSDVQLTRSLLDKHKLTFGTEITDNFKQDQSDFNPVGNPPYFPVPYHSVIWAIYGQGEFAITPKVSLSAGVRYDHYFNGFGGTTNPRLGLIYHVFHSTTAKVLYGSAFRAPEPYELYPAFANFYENNPELEPETIRTIEGVVDQGLGERVSVEVSVFQNRISKLITLHTDPSTGLSVYQNSDAARSTGVELELNARLVAGLRGRASYSYTRTIDAVTLQTPPNSPANLLKLNLGLPLLHQKLFAAADAQYASAVSTLAGNTLSGFAVVNGTLTGHIWGKHLDVGASVYNLLNKKYADPARPEDPEDAIPQDGRTFAVKTTLRLFH
jgi:outer membrane receptor protein involved in Fe transport